MAIVLNLQGHSVALTGGYILGPGEQRNVNTDDDYMESLIADGLIAVIGPDTPPPPDEEPLKDTIRKVFVAHQQPTFLAEGSIWFELDADFQYTRAWERKSGVLELIDDQGSVDDRVTALEGGAIAGMVSVKTFGAKGDALKLTDGATTSGQATLTCASATFTAADVGKKIIVRGGAARVVADAAITASANVLTSATAAFTSADIGKPVVVVGAGSAGSDHKTTISGFTNATTVTLTANAVTTVSGAGATVDMDLMTTVTAYVSASQVTLAAMARASLAGATVIYGTDDSAAFRAAAASGSDIFVPRGGYLVDGTVLVNTAGQLWFGEGTSSIVYQTKYARPTFDVSYQAPNVIFERIKGSYANTKTARPSWTYAERDATTNAFVNQDSTISRSAFILNGGADKLTVRFCTGENVYTFCRQRSRDRFNDTVHGFTFTGNGLDHFQMGLVIMNTRAPQVTGNQFRDTDATDTAPPHAIYCAGVPPVPSNVTADPLDPDEDPPPYDTPITGGIFANNTDYRNLYSTSWKMRGLRGTIVRDLVSVGCARTFESAWCQDVDFFVYGYDGQQVVSTTTGLPVDSSTQSAAQMQYSSNCTLNGRMHTTHGELLSGWTIRANNYRLRYGQAHASATYQANTGSRAPFKTVDSGGTLFENVSWESVGFDRASVTFFNSDANTVMPPKATHGNPAHQKMFSFDSTSDNNKVIVDTDLLGVTVTQTGIKTDAGTGNQIVKRAATVALP